MPFVSSVIASAPLLAYRYGFFTFLFIGFGVVLAGYAVYWMIFKVREGLALPPRPSTRALTSATSRSAGECRACPPSRPPSGCTARSRRSG